MSMRRGPATVAVALNVLAVLGLAGCGSDANQGDAVKITGDCSTSENHLKPQQLISETMLGHLVGDADYVALPGVVVDKAHRVPAAYTSSCSFAPADNQAEVRLKIALVPRSDPRYLVAQQALEAKEGVRVVDADTYVTEDPTSDAHGNRVVGAKGVRVLPDRLVMVEILRPRAGIDAMEAAAKAVAAVTDNLEHLS